MLGDMVTLNNGVQMPRLGLGVWQSENGTETVNAVKWAIEAGYRHIDTASMYENEESVGQGIHESGVPRGDIFVTSKLHPDDQGYDETLRAFDATMQRLGFDTLDLYLIHWPRPAAKRAGSWQALEKLYQDGRVRAIGVSNYAPDHVNELLAQGKVVPAVNQFELTPYNYRSREALVTLCREHEIAVEAYSPLARGRKLDDPRLVALAEKYARTPAQIMLRYLVQQDVIIIPKSVNEGRIRENGNVFDFTISEDDMLKLSGLDEALAYAPDPFTMA